MFGISEHDDHETDYNLPQLNRIKTQLFVWTLLILERMESNFGIVDYFVFIFSLFLPLVVGVFYAIKDRKTTSTESYYFGGRKLSPILVGFSISVTFLSSITVIGYPTEVYVYGAVTFWYAFALVVPAVIGYVYYIPLFYNLKLTSIYELLEMRFNKTVRMITSAISIFNMILYMGVTIYAPALALSAVTPIKLDWAIALTSLICTLYTAAGGVKAVIWTDAIQSIFIFTGIISMFVRTVVLIGGWDNLFSALAQGHRTKFFDFRIDPTLRITSWSGCFGSSIIALSGLCSNQLIPQRYLSCKSLSDARKSVVFGLIMFGFLSIMALCNGLAMYAYFKGCDPILSGKVARPDQLAPYLSTLIFREISGFTGIFVAAAYSGTLSTISSGINALANLLLEDFVLKRWPNMENKRRLTVSKTFVLLLGLLVTSIAYLASLWGATVFKIIYVTFGTFGAPVLGLFTLAIFVPWCNAKGAIIGALIGTVSATWVAIGGILHPRPLYKNGYLPLSVDECPVPTTTQSFYTEVVSSNYNATEFDLSQGLAQRYTTGSSGLYAMSHLLYGFFGFLVTIFFGILVSFCTGAEDPKEADPKLFMPLFDNHRLPRKIRLFFRFGVPELMSHQNGNGYASGIPLNPADSRKDILA